MDLKRNRVSTLPVLGMVMKVMAVALLTRNAGAHLWFRSGFALVWRRKEGSPGNSGTVVTCGIWVSCREPK